MHKVKIHVKIVVVGVIFVSKFLNAFHTMSSKTKLFVKLVLAFFAVCIILVLVLGIFNNRKLSYAQIEEKLVSAAKNYYADHEDLLPKQNGGTVSVDSLTLIENEYMKELEKYNKEDATCSAVVTVTNNNEQYLYIPSLKCEDYQTTSLYEQILKDQAIVTEGSGLYEVGTDYVYRGEYPNNYVKFAGKLWRILRLTSGSEIRLISVDPYEETYWDNRYNVNAESTTGINTYEISRIKDAIDVVYGENFKEKDRAFIVSKRLCVGKRKPNEKDNSGAVECATLTEGSYPVGLLQVNEYVVASIDTNCKLQTDTSCVNYNYLAKLQNNFWTLTASSLNDYEVFFVNSSIRSSETSEYKFYNITVNIDGNITYQSGNGTEENPYEIS